MVILADFCLLNVILLFFLNASPWTRNWSGNGWILFMICCNLSMIFAESRIPPIVHQRMISAGEILKRNIGMVMIQTVVAYLLLKAFNYHLAVGRLMISIGAILMLLILVSRLFERILIKSMRAMGRNTRMVTFVGSDQELISVYKQLIADATTGYRLLGYYADQVIADAPNSEHFIHLGTLSQLLKGLKDGTAIIEDELYLCVSRKEGRLIQIISKYCERHMKRFYFVPIAEETQRVNLRREQIEDLEIYSTYESPLLSPVNKILKRGFDIVFSSIALLLMLPLYPLMALIIKWQSPGPILFRQKRTGLDGRTFTILKFRSMHVNAEADSLQATKDDPRKFPFGEWMRRTNVDELPQFWNVLKGDMSIVGPRPHMLAHTEFYSEQIDKYMVRHFVKPGITGWAQVTGYRGETSELWQMEGRVKRDIWYMEHWSIWLDIRIIWKTIKAMFLSNNKNAC